MAMRFCILGSGSSGNSALVVTEGARVLVDAGFSGRRLSALLDGVGESLARVDAVFLTHEHIDHCAGIEGLKRHPHVRVFANQATARAVQANLSHTPAWQIFETGASFTFKDIEVESFPVPHDAQEPVGYRFTHGREGDLFSRRATLAWVTDLGHVPPAVQARLGACEVLAVESNHCPRMLESDPKRSWTLKRRISGRHGHLSNERMGEALAQAQNPRWRRVYLTHLSRDCNTREAVEAALRPVRERVPCEVSIVGHGEGTPFYEVA